MAPIDPTCVVILDQPSNEVREAVHQLVRANANGWWHQLPDVWLVGGKEAGFWRDLCRDAVTGSSTAVLVFRLPETTANRAWAYFGQRAEARMEWVHKNYR